MAHNHDVCAIDFPARCLATEKWATTPTVGETSAAGLGAGGGGASSDPSAAPSLVTTDAAALSDEVLAEQLTRNLQFFGSEAQGRVAKSFVVVVGLGVRQMSPSPHWPLWSHASQPPPSTASTHMMFMMASARSPATVHALMTNLSHATQGVGSHAAHLLLRSGVGKLRLIDFDQVM